MTIDPTLLYQHPGVALPNHEIIAAIRSWLITHRELAEKFVDDNLHIRAGDPGIHRHILTAQLEGSYEWSDYASMATVLRDPLFLMGVHLEAENGYSLGVYRWEPVTIPTLAEEAQARSMVLGVTFGRALSRGDREAIGASIMQGIRQDFGLQADGGYEGPFAIDVREVGAVDGVHIVGVEVPAQDATPPEAEARIDNLRRALAGVLFAPGPLDDGRRAIVQSALAADDGAMPDGHRLPYSCIASHPEEGRAHPKWPAKEGVEVGCCNRKCSVCYVQTATERGDRARVTITGFRGGSVSTAPNPGTPEARLDDVEARLASVERRLAALPEDIGY